MGSHGEDLSLQSGIGASSLVLEPQGWDWSHETEVVGWDWNLEAGIGAMTLGMEP